MHACSAVDRAVEFWICFVALRHCCLTAATAPPEPVVVAVVVVAGDGEVGGEEVVLELPHAPSANAAATSTTRSGVR